MERPGAGIDLWDGTDLQHHTVCVCVCVSRQMHIICVLFLISSKRKEKQTAGFTDSM